MPLIFVCELLCQDFLVALENLTLVALAPDKCRSDQQRERYANDCESNDADFQAFFTHGLFWQDSTIRHAGLNSGHYLFRKYS